MAIVNMMMNDKDHELSTVDSSSSIPQLLSDNVGEHALDTVGGATLYKYRDFSSVAEDDDEIVETVPSPVNSTNRGGMESSIRVQKFPVKLYAILAQKEFQDIITWMPHGRSWKVLKPSVFEGMVMPLFFEYSNYHSFNRLVNAWSFRRVSSGPDRGSYYHELFLRGKPHLHKYMRRLPKTHKKLPMKKGDEPDFYMLDKSNPLPALDETNVPKFSHTVQPSQLTVQQIHQQQQQQQMPQRSPQEAFSNQFDTFNGVSGSNGNLGDNLMQQRKQQLNNMAMGLSKVDTNSSQFGMSSPQGFANNNFNLKNNSHNAECLSPLLMSNDLVVQGQNNMLSNMYSQQQQQQQQLMSQSQQQNSLALSQLQRSQSQNYPSLSLQDIGGMGPDDFDVLPLPPDHRHTQQLFSGNLMNRNSLMNDEAALMMGNQFNNRMGNVNGLSNDFNAGGSNIYDNNFSNARANMCQPRSFGASQSMMLNDNVDLADEFFFQQQQQQQQQMKMKQMQQQQQQMKMMNVGAAAQMGGNGRSLMFDSFASPAMMDDFGGIKMSSYATASSQHA